MPFHHLFGGVKSFPRGFQYEDLERDSEIRLLHLHPGSGDEAIKCDVQHFVLGCQAYEALSYEWGQQSSNDPEITLCGSKVQIRRNLFEALLRLRNKDKARDLWIDALYINQANGKERNHQVQLMGKIYSGAEQVIVWLGMPGSDSDLAINWIECIHERYQASREPTDKYHYSFQPRGSHAQLLAAEYVHHQRHPWPSYRGLKNEFAWPWDRNLTYVQDNRWQSLLLLLKRPYWRRMWIIQEIQLTQQLTFCCGPRSFSGHALKDVCNFIIATSEEELAGQIGYIVSTTFKDLKATFAINLFGRRRAESTPPKLRLKTWLYDCIRLGCTCSEPRDTVYALLGISGDCQEGELVPDYVKPLLEVYHDAMVTCTKNPPMPEINDSWLATKLALVLDLNLELDELAWPLLSSETLIESCH